MHVLWQIISVAAEAGDPIAMFCKLGKDRTGLVCMLLLSCCGASDQEIISDYIRSVTEQHRSWPCKNGSALYAANA